MQRPGFGVSIPHRPFAEQSKLWLKLLGTGALKKPLNAKKDIESVLKTYQ